LLHDVVHHLPGLTTQAVCCLPCTVEHGTTSFAALTGWLQAYTGRVTVVRGVTQHCLFSLTAMQAFARLAVRLLVHQLQESPTLLGACTPAAVLVPALGQLLTYGTDTLQVNLPISFLSARTHTDCCFHVLSAYLLTHTHTCL